MKSNKIKYFSCLALCMCAVAVKAQHIYTLFSPNKKIELRLSIDDSVQYQVLLDYRQLMRPASIFLHPDFLKNSLGEVSGVKRSTLDQTLHPVVWQKSATIRHNYNQLAIDFSQAISLEWRAYNNGVAWRWIVHKNTPYKILGETANFNFQSEDSSWYPADTSFYSSFEATYHHLPVNSIGPASLGNSPALFEDNGIDVLITESNLLDYAGMWLQGNNDGKIEATFPHYPKETKVTSPIDQKVITRDDFIAQYKEPKKFPWRVIMIARQSKDLLTNQLVYQLADSAKGDYNWVKPGKAAWDWWNGRNLAGVDFRAGINMKTYKYYIDFASRFGLKYFLIDGGWSSESDILHPRAGIDIKALADYATQKHVRLLLWVSWLALDKHLNEALDQYSAWGIKGIKVDFMQRDDQPMVEFCTRVAKAAAARKMLVDFHGVYKPTGLYRTYPNVITSEGVHGAEYLKWEKAMLSSPEHAVTLPFIRMAAGPMDYTPGAMRNAQKQNWAPFMNRPMSLGTRCQQLAMYVIFESPLQMLADSPTEYEKSPECMQFLENVPVEWRQTIPLQAKTGEYILMARQAQNGDWYIGAMTNWSSRDLQFDLSFLGKGHYLMRVWKDGPNADRNAEDFKMETHEVNANTGLQIHLTKGGGWVARIAKLK
jgi:alpha-glucosidase